MPLSSSETAQLFQVFGIPQRGSAYEASRITSVIGTQGETHDLSVIVSKLNDAITDLNSDADRLTRAQALLTEWDSITSYSEARVLASGGSQGVLADDARRRENIRMGLANLLGFWVPKGGFAAEQARRDHRIIR